MVSERRPRPSLARAREELRREIDAVDEEARFGEEMCVPALPTGHVEDAGARRQPENLDEACHLTTISLEREEGLVLAKVDVVEVRGPPVRTLRLRAAGGLI